MANIAKITSIVWFCMVLGYLKGSFRVYTPDKIKLHVILEEKLHVTI